MLQIAQPQSADPSANPEPYAALVSPADSMRAILEISDELMAESSLDTIWRKAVELARSRLGIERCSIWRYDAESKTCTGTYGTDLNGLTVNESAQSFHMARGHSLLQGRHRPSGERSWSAHQDESRITQHGGESKCAWVVDTPIRVRNERQIAIMFNDCAISHALLDEQKQDMLAVYCSTLGSIVSQKELERELQQANMALEQRVARRTAQLAARIDAERLLLDITSDFVRSRPEDMQATIESALRRVCMLIRAKSGHTFLLADNGVSIANAYAWQDDDLVSALADHGAASFYTQHPQWHAIMRDDQVVAASTLSELPAGMEAFARWLEARGIGAIVSLPLIAGGNLIGELGFNIRAPSRVWKPDEITLLRVLAKSIAGALDRARIAQALQAERDSLERRVDERTQQLQAVMDLSQSLSAKLDIGPMLDQALGSLAQIMPFSRAVVWTLESDGAFAPIRVHDTSGHRQQIGHLQPEREPGSAINRMFENLTAVVIEDIWADTAMTNSYRRGYERVNGHAPDGFASALLVPLKVEQRITGFLTLSGVERGAFDRHDAQLAQALANQIAISIENAQLHHKSVQTAALTERNRLARELHDSVSQALFGIVLAARTLMQSLPPGNERLPQIGEYLLRLSEAALIEMRALIFELRPESLEKLGLIAALQKQAAELCARTQLVLRVKTSGQEPNLPLAAKESIYRIGIEALQNTIKHAQATAVDLEIDVVDGSVEMEIRDDGVGFDVDADHGDHLGMKSMRERAEQNGGTLRVTSNRSQGSTVRVSIPLNIIKSAFATQR